MAKADAGPVEAPGTLAMPGGGYGFGCVDPEGRSLAFVTDVSDHDDLGPIADRVIKIAHINLNTSAMDKTFAFFTDGSASG